MNHVEIAKKKLEIALLELQDVCKINSQEDSVGYLINEAIYNCVDNKDIKIAMNHLKDSIQ